MNAIKTKYRNRLHGNDLDNVMRMKFRFQLETLLIKKQCISIRQHTKTDIETGNK